MHASRKDEYQKNRRLTAPERIGNASTQQVAAPPIQTVRSDQPAETPGDTGISGEGIVGGEATGRARIVYQLDDATFLDSLTDDDILVLPHGQAFFYADWHSLLMLVKGIVTPGIPSHHLTQVARECGIPIVGKCKGDLSTIPDCSKIRIDGRTGRVALI
jgi:phosphohistidine swiveling domain-containing protein